GEGQEENEVDTIKRQETPSSSPALRGSSYRGERLEQPRSQSWAGLGTHSGAGAGPVRLQRAIRRACFGGRYGREGGICPGAEPHRAARRPLPRGGSNGNQT